jgi:hypothetical protein
MLSFYHFGKRGVSEIVVNRRDVYHIERFLPLLQICPSSDIYLRGIKQGENGGPAPWGAGLPLGEVNQWASWEFATQTELVVYLNPTILVAVSGFCPFAESTEFGG